MILDEIRSAQIDGVARGIPSICSAHPAVLEQALTEAKSLGQPALIEATCNQVNQFGGYSGLTPEAFFREMLDLADRCKFPKEDLVLGGDHLGPSVWQSEPADTAMRKAEDLIRAYARAGFKKIHIDCSMKLGGDLPGPLDPVLAAGRTARLAQIACASGDDLRFVIGSEVPLPGGATAREEAVQPTTVDAAREAIEATRAEFQRLGLAPQWDLVIALVVQPGVEFGDDFVIPYRPADAGHLVEFIRGTALVYEAHSTDYQSPAALRRLVRDRFAILKVGPALTFAFREAVFAMACIETELVAAADRSNIVTVIDSAMRSDPVYWQNHYRGEERDLAYKRKFSLSDRMRYYWVRPEVRGALERLEANLSRTALPDALLSQFAPLEYEALREKGRRATYASIVGEHLARVIHRYYAACAGDDSSSAPGAG